VYSVVEGISGRNKPEPYQAANQWMAFVENPYHAISKHTLHSQEQSTTPTQGAKGRVQGPISFGLCIKRIILDIWPLSCQVKQ